MRKLTLEGNIVIFKAIAIPKIVFQAFITTAQNILSMNLKKHKKIFLGIILLLR